MGRSSEVINTFAPSTINITLNESDLKADGTLDTSQKVIANNDYKMIPGLTLLKDPTVTVEKGSEACWLFIKVEEEGVSGKIDGTDISYNVDEFLTYIVDPTYWTKLEGYEKEDEYCVYYYKGDLLKKSLEKSESFCILEDNQLQVNASITKEMMDNVATLKDYPKLKFTAYASQYMNGSDIFTVRDAWLNITGK